jgi:hypothetical protein
VRTLAWIAPFFVLCSSIAHADISPDCVGIDTDVALDDSKQRAHLQNYFSSAFLFTPMSPVPGSGATSQVGLELSLIPPLSCYERLVKFGGQLKTENTNLSPLLPRPRLTVGLPKAGPVHMELEAGFIPPIPLPFGNIAHLGAAFGAGAEVIKNLGVGARAHFSMTRVRAEVATPLDAGALPYDDLSYFWGLGGDFGVSYRIAHKHHSSLTPYLWAGYGQTQTLFIVGDDFEIVQNTDYPWKGAVITTGAQLALLSNRLLIGFDAMFAVPVYSTLQFKIAYGF